MLHHEIKDRIWQDLKAANERGSRHADLKGLHENLIFFLERMLARDIERDEVELKDRLEQIDQQLKLIMIAQDVIDAAAKGLTDAANNIIAHLPPSTTASTPDTSVQGLLGTVGAVTAQLNAAAGPATPAAAPPVTP
jgi:hypothetical protein